MILLLLIAVQLPYIDQYTPPRDKCEGFSKSQCEKYLRLRKEIADSYHHKKAVPIKDSKPQLIVAVKPDSLQEWCPGTSIELSFEINSLGSTGSIYLTTPALSDLGKDAIRTLRLWKFRPAFKNGEAVSSTDHRAIYRCEDNDAHLLLYTH